MDGITGLAVRVQLHLGCADSFRVPRANQPLGHRGEFLMGWRPSEIGCSNYTRLRSRFGLERSRRPPTWEFAAGGERICALKFPVTDGLIRRWVYTIRTAASCTPVQVRDLRVLDEAFRDALDRSSGGQVCTNLT
jgi:hypothetical protein